MFSIVGNSRNLFEKCLQLNDLETAASYLVVLQNTESLKVCEELANMLLKACLKNCVWDLIQEIIRFLTSIDPADLENEVFDQSANDSQVLNGSKQQDHSFNLKFLKSKNNSRSSNSSLVSPTKKQLTKEESLDSTKNDESFRTKSKLSKKTSFNLNESELLSKKSIETTIYEYGTELLKSFRIKKLFEMFSNLSGFNLEKWLQQYQSNALVDNFVQALSSLHFDFNWPYPIMINELKTTKSFLVEEPNGKKASDFLFEVKEENAKLINGTDKHKHDDEITNTDSDSFDFHLVAQELANTGSSQSEVELLYIIETFQVAKCYEWVFLLAIILKNFTILNEIMRQMRTPEIPANIAKSIRDGLVDLDLWARNECCGYQSIIHKIKTL